MKKIVWLSFQVIDRTLSKTALFEISEHLSKRGYKTSFFCIRSKKALENNNLNMNVVTIPIRVFPLITHLFYVTFLTLLLPFYVILKQPTFIITEPKFGAIAFGLSLKIFPRKLKPKMILDVRSTPVGVHGKRAFLNAISFNATIFLSKKIFDGYTIVTENMKREILEQFQIRDKAVKVWTNGVNLELFDTKLYDGAKFKKTLGLGDKLVVFYHGAISADRGIIEAIKSIDLLKENYPDIVLFILGTGRPYDLALIDEKIKTSHLQENVLIHKPVDYSEVPKYISMSDVGLVPLPNIPDWRYQCPLKLIEYISMGKPVIITEIPANREVVGSSKFAISVPRADSDEFTKAIIYAYKNIETLRKTSLEGKLIAKERYDWTKIAQKLETFLDEFEKSP
jgi:glycosyltransferase involved in cell wall biosynthesis